MVYVLGAILDVTTVKVGDLVEPKMIWTGNEYVGVVIEVGVYAGNKDTKVLWEDGRILTYASKYMKVISESR